MSLASTWAAAVAARETEAAATQAQEPPMWSGTNFSATVSRNGGVTLDKAVTLTPTEALDLGQWLIATFGD
jgi:hypothetical protein